MSNSTLKAFTTEEQKPSQHFLTEWQFKKSSFVNNAVQSNDDALQTALIKRDENLTPNSTEQTAITNLVNTIQSVLDGLIVSGICY